MSLCNAMLLGAAALSGLSACAASPYGYDYRQAQRIECVATAGSVVAANRLASDYGSASGRDIDAYDDFDRDTLWTSLAIAGFGALLAGRTPGGDDVCAGINRAGDLIYDQY